MNCEINSDKLSDVDIIEDQSSQLLPNIGFISPDRPHWHWVVGLLFFMASIALIALAQASALLFYSFRNGMDLTSKEAFASAVASPDAIFYSILSVFPAHLVTFILGYVIVTNFGKSSFKEALGWKWNGFTIWSCLIFFGCFMILAGILQATVGFEETELSKLLSSSRGTSLAVAFMATFTAPVVEELVYRGVLYSGFKKSFGTNAAVLVVTLLFAIVHFPQYFESVASLVMITFLSLALTLVRVWTGNLLPCIVLHTLVNGIQSLLIVMQPYLPPAETASF